MIVPRRRSRQTILWVFAAAFLLYATWRLAIAPRSEFARLEKFMNSGTVPRDTLAKSSFDWSQVQFDLGSPQKTLSRALPKSRIRGFPTVQHRFDNDSPAEMAQREARRDSVRQVFQKDWQHYRERAWGKDAVNPISGTSKDQFSGWAATLVDSLDTLWIMGLRAEFDEAVAAVAQIDFGQSTSPRVNIFETNIRYLGGLLAAYDLSGRSVLLAKAVELGNLLYAGFNTDNGMPVDFIDFNAAKAGSRLEVEEWVVAASPGSLSMEMTRLSQITGDMKYFDAAAAVMRVFYEQQNKTRLPGLWPIWISMRSMDVSARAEFTLGGSGDSNHEYLPKMYALLGGWETMYEKMTRDFMRAAGEHMFFRPMVPGEEDILISGNVQVDDDGEETLDPESEHLACFVGGTMALGGRLLRQPDDVETGAKLARGCMYVYQSFPTGIMPERYNMVPCDPPQARTCDWNETQFHHEKKLRPEWQPHLPLGFTTAKDPRYLLRPEAIESVFVNYRITGDREFREKAWDMFQAVTNGSAAEFGHASIKDVTRTAEELPREDYMEVSASLGDLLVDTC